MPGFAAFRNCQARLTASAVQGKADFAVHIIQNQISPTPANRDEKGTPANPSSSGKVAHAQHRAAYLV
jgi:hypothetical protein